MLGVKPLPCDWSRLNTLRKEEAQARKHQEKESEELELEDKKSSPYFIIMLLLDDGHDHDPAGLQHYSLPPGLEHYSGPPGLKTLFAVKPSRV